MEKTAGALADMLVEKSIVEGEDRDFYKYAIETAIIYVINIATMFILAIITKRLPELILLLVTLYPLRSSCGGKHMKKWYSCYIVSCTVFEVAILLSGDMRIHAAVMCVVLSTCVCCIWRFAPLEHKDHIMEEKDFENNRKRVRILSICVAVAAFIFKYSGFETGASICVSSEVLCCVLLMWGVLEKKIYNNKNKCEDKNYVFRT